MLYLVLFLITFLLLENPDTIKVFTKATSITIEFIKACLLGTAKSIVQKCLKLFNENFPQMTRFCVSKYWQCEFKYELNMILANIADQCQLDYMALQYIIDALNELAIAKLPDQEANLEHNPLKDSSKYSLVAQSLENKRSKFIKKGIFEIYNVISKAHINTRLWLNARKEFVRCMFNQLSDLGKAKGIDTNIMRDFGEFKYYCERGIHESSLFQDIDSESYFKFYLICFDLIQINNVDQCLKHICDINVSLGKSLQPSFETQLLFIKSKILQIDLAYSNRILNESECVKVIDDTIQELYQIQNFILELLKYHGESIEFYKDRTVAYFDRLYDIKNLSNSFLNYLVQTKLRLGSCLLLRGSQSNDYLTNKYFEDASLVFNGALQLNKVITERSLSLEIELKYKYSRCLRELFKKREISLRDVVESYLETIDLIYGSTHDLGLIKNCYLELSMAFIHLVDDTWSTLSTASATPSTASSRSRRTTTTQSKAIEGALICLTLATKASQSTKEKMLLPGHSALKQMDTLITQNSPLFVANDILAYYVLAERKPVYKNEIEEEILTLAPEFAPKETYQTYDDNFNKLKNESDSTITWIHLLNYQIKLQRISSMRNLNQLANGKNRFRFSELYTIGFTPIFNNERQISSRLYYLNKYMSENLSIYASECLAEYPLVEYLRKMASKATSSAYIVKDFRYILDELKLYEGNLGKTERKPVSIQEQGDSQHPVIEENQHENEQENENTIEWSNLKIYPLNFNPSVKEKQTNRYASDSSQILTQLVTINWYKDVLSFNFNSVSSIELITCSIGIKDTKEHQIRLKLLSADKLHDVHNKLANLAAIADTALNTTDENKSDMKSQFIVSLIKSIFKFNFILPFLNKEFTYYMYFFNWRIIWKILNKQQIRLF